MIDRRPIVVLGYLITGTIIHFSVWGDDLSVWAVLALVGSMTLYLLIDRPR